MGNQKILVALTLLLAVVANESFASRVFYATEKRPIADKEAAGREFQSALRAVTEEFNLRSNSMMHHAILRYEHATKQSLSESNNIRYTFVAVLVETRCRKVAQYEHKPLAWCKEKLSHNAKVYSCPVSVVYEPLKSQKFEVDRSGFASCSRVHRLDKKAIQHHVILGGDSHDVGHYGQFVEFKQKHGRTYETEEEEHRRFEIFRENMKKAMAFQLLDHGDATYGASQFADLTEKEFRQLYLTPKWDLSWKPKAAAAQPVKDLPTSFDWREHGAVTKVKNQGSCGSCWAFSTTGNIEGQWFLKKKQLLSLSEQELVDCDKVDLGCNGGLPTQAYKEIQRLGGLMTESDYPYAGRGQQCKFNKAKVAAYVNGSVSISTNETQIAAWLVNNGPISIGINANAMQFYLGGVSHPWKIFCNPGHLDHGVLIVGYGVKGTEPYWIIKNSWGPLWGQRGYYLVFRGDGTCGLNQMCTSAVVR